MMFYLGQKSVRDLQGPCAVSHLHRTLTFSKPYPNVSYRKAATWLRAAEGLGRNDLDAEDGEPAFRRSGRMLACGRSSEKGEMKR